MSAFLSDASVDRLKIKYRNMEKDEGALRMKGNRSCHLPQIRLRMR